ncbi:hypothetical protein ACFVZW_23550 [Streptomyces sp. NPDC059567]|uniref:hypothetical protein n=1 Tax=Streptomyces sp. NPDC059567 TaxID=3346867 RepID=UPI0036D09BA6
MVQAARLGLGFAATGLADRAGVRYPLFVDPPLNPGWDAWTVAYKPYPTTSFFNGTNFNSGTSEARVGSENETPRSSRRSTTARRTSPPTVRPSPAATASSAPRAVPSAGPS